MLAVLAGLAKKTRYFKYRTKRGRTKPRSYCKAGLVWPVDAWPAQDILLTFNIELSLILT